MRPLRPRDMMPGLHYGLRGAAVQFTVTDMRLEDDGQIWLRIEGPAVDGWGIPHPRLPGTWLSWFSPDHETQYVELPSPDEVPI